MAWDGSLIHYNSTDFLYAKPKQISAAPSWSADIVSASKNAAFEREYEFRDLDDSKTYVIFRRVGGTAAATDIPEAEISRPVGADAATAATEAAAARLVVEADQVVVVEDGDYKVRTTERGTTTQLIPDKILKRPGPTDLTNPATQQYGGAAQEPI